MKCTSCGSEFTGNFCPNCGMAAASANDQEMAPSMPLQSASELANSKPRKKRSAGKIVLLILAIVIGVPLVLIILLAIFSPNTGSGKGTNTTAAAPAAQVKAVEDAAQAEPEPTPEPTPYKAPDTLTGRNWSVRAIGVTHDYSVLFDSLYVRVECEVTNISKENQTFNPFLSDTFMLNNNGVLDGGGSDYDDQKIAPGASFETTLVFLFPYEANTDYSLMTLSMEGDTINLGDIY